MSVTVETVKTVTATLQFPVTQDNLKPYSESFTEFGTSVSDTQPILSSNLLELAKALAPRKARAKKATKKVVVKKDPPRRAEVSTDIVSDDTLDDSPKFANYDED